MSKPNPTALVILAVVAVLFAVAGGYCIFQADTWTDEITYLVKSWWYVSGEVAPYSDQDATWYMPLYFYQLGAAQWLFGLGHVTGRVMSWFFGAGSAVMVFLLSRRITANDVVSALAAALYLLAPPTVYYFTSVTPLATVAFLHLLVLYLVIAAPARAEVWRSAAIGVLFWSLFFYRQNMILGIAILAPFYLYLIKERRVFHASVAAGSALAGTLLLIILFPAKLFGYALRLPVITPLMLKFHLLPHSIQLGLENSYAPGVNPDFLGFNWSMVVGEDIVNSFVLPYAGTLLLVMLSLVFRQRRDSRRLFLPLYFLFMATTHYLGAVAYCATCLLTYANYFVGVGAVCAAMALQGLWQHSKGSIARLQPVVASVFVVAVVANLTATALVTSSNPMVERSFRFFPLPLLGLQRTQRELAELRTLERDIATKVPAGGTVLVLQTPAPLAYAAVRAGHPLIIQSLNLLQSYRAVSTSVPTDQRAAVVTALDNEALWSDELLVDWITRRADVVIFQNDPYHARQDIEQMLDLGFRRAGFVISRGQPADIFIRLPRA